MASTFIRYVSMDGFSPNSIAAPSLPQIRPLFYDYQSNVPHYPAWQAYFREYQPPTLIVWGKNGDIFPADGVPRVALAA